MNGSEGKTMAKSTMIIAACLLVLCLVILLETRKAYGIKSGPGDGSTGVVFGLAANYPGDKGLENDPNVIYFLDFDNELVFLLPTIIHISLPRARIGFHQ
jgi:hypothetical protein